MASEITPMYPAEHTASDRSRRAHDAGSSASNAPAAHSYRKDIDGLRAIAVIGVILFHAQVPGFGGGYIGVDIFFVISGYLITLLLVERKELPPRTQLATFYLRRARRILPALLVVLLVTSGAALVLLLPSDLVTFGKYLAAAPAMLSNIAAWSERSYFAAGIPDFGLLHLWSISVEEQFYLFYPVALLVADRYWPHRRLLILAIVGAISLVACVWASFEHPVVNFYFAPMRAWELMLGAIVAIGASNWSVKRSAAEALTLLSIVVIALCAHFYWSGMHYPGLLALPPCASAAILIAVGRRQQTLTGRALSSRPFVFTGLISYSLYLWHLPILSLAKYYNIQPLGPAALVAALSALFVIACASWKWVEQPIRGKSLLIANRTFVATAIAWSCVLSASGVVILSSNGFPRRFSPDVQMLAASQAQYPEDMGKCMAIPPAVVQSGALCRYGTTDRDAPKIVVWGDSHAASLIPAYAELARTDGFGLYLAAWSDCRPLVGPNLHQSPSCIDFNEGMLAAIRKLDPDVVVLNAHWLRLSVDFMSRPYATLDASGESELTQAVEATVRRIGAAHRVCIVFDVPLLQLRAPYMLAMARRRGLDEDALATHLDAVRDQFESIEDNFRALQRRDRIATADPKEILCEGDACAIRLGEQALYFDTNHLSITGARLVAPAIGSCLNDLPRRTEPNGGVGKEIAIR